MTLIFVCGKLPGPERRAGRGIRDRGAASGSNPDSSPRVCPTSRLVNGSHSGRRWGEPQLKVKTAFGQTQLTIRAYHYTFSLFLRFFDGQTMSCIFFLLASHMTEIDIVQSDSAWFYCCVGTRRSAYPLLPLVCSITELVTWSSTSSRSATHSWQRSWLNNTSRSSWARPSMYITHTHIHTCCLIFLLKCKFTSLF